MFFARVEVKKVPGLGKQVDFARVLLATRLANDSRDAVCQEIAERFTLRSRWTTRRTTRRSNQGHNLATPEVGYKQRKRRRLGARADAVRQGAFVHRSPKGASLWARARKGSRKTYVLFCLAGRQDFDQRLDFPDIENKIVSINAPRLWADGPRLGSKQTEPPASDSRGWPKS